MWLGSGHLLQQVDISDIPVLSSTVRVVQSARDLGVILDSQLSLSAHIAALCRSGFYQLRQIRPAIRSLTPDTARTIVQAFIACRLDWCNSLLYGVPENLLRKVFPGDTPYVQISTSYIKAFESYRLTDGTPQKTYSTLLHGWSIMYYFRA